MRSVSPFLPRDNLIEKVLRAVNDHALTVVVAPMGYGKTTLADSLHDALGGNAFFHSTPAGPHDARFLWCDIFDAFEKQGMDVNVLRRNGFPETASQRAEAVRRISCLVSPVYFIFDDYHQVTDPAISAFWETVVKTGIPDFHLVLLSRTRPDMNLEELRIKGLATLFDQSLLAFTDAEASAYFTLYNADATAALEAQKYSEGWPAALWLCLKSWQACGKISPSPDIESLLANTVFATYDSRERELLMRLSVLEVFTAEDADRLSASSGTATLLRTLHEKNAFLFFDAKSGFYQFHSIFRDFLRKELAAAPHIDKIVLHSAAGECCLERCNFIQAMRHFQRAGRDEDLCRLLDMFMLDDYDRNAVFFFNEIFDAINALPTRVRILNPLGYVTAVALFVVMWNDERSLSMLAEAENFLRSTQDLPDYLKRKLRGELEGVRGVLAFNDAARTWQHYANAHELLDGPSSIISRDICWNFGCPSISFLYLRQGGGLSELMDIVQKHWHLYTTLSHGIGRHGDKIMFAEADLERGMLDQVEPVLRFVLRRSPEDKQIATVLSATFCLARLFVALGDSEGACRVLREDLPSAQDLEGNEMFDCRDLIVGYISACLGMEQEIPRWLRVGETFDTPHDALPCVFGFSLVVHCKSLLLQRAYHRLPDALADIPLCHARVPSVLLMIHGKILEAITAWHLQGKDAAMAPLKEALELSRPDSLVLALAEYGGHLAPLLRHHALHNSDDEHFERVLLFTERIARVCVYPGKKHDNGLLTPREREFMRHVAGGLSNPTIAAKLGIAEITVRKALGRAYIKLGVSNRVEAAQRYREIYDRKEPATG